MRNWKQKKKSKAMPTIWQGGNSKSSITWLANWTLGQLWTWFRWWATDVAWIVVAAAAAAVRPEQLLVVACLFVAGNFCLHDTKRQLQTQSIVHTHIYTYTTYTLISGAKLRNTKNKEAKASYKRNFSVSRQPTWLGL